MDEGEESGPPVTLIPECQADGKIAGCWSSIGGMTVFASEGKPSSAQSLDHYRFPVLNEVRWHADMYSTMMRKLINETHGIFLDLQQLPELGNRTKKASLLTISRRYRAVLRACLLKYKEQSESMVMDGNQNTNTQKQILTYVELVWHLCEILFIETLPGGAALPRLLEWAKTEQTERFVDQVLQCAIPYESPAYWPAIYSLLLRGQLNDARELLKQHPDRHMSSYDAFESIDELMRKMPEYKMYMGQTSSEFLMKWHSWQFECKSQLESETFAGYPYLETICQILAGKEDIFDNLKDSCPTWYQMLTAKLLYCNPAVKVYDLQYHTQSCIEMFGGVSELGGLDRILLSAFEFDVCAVIKDSSECLGNWWFVAHLTDLLHHAGQLDSHRVSSPISLREFLILEYSASLMSHHSLWQIAVDYLRHCPEFGRAHLEEYIEHLPLETEKKALKVIRICEEMDMAVQVQSICRTLGIQALKKGRLGSALMWCLRSKDSVFAAFIANRYLDSYIKSGQFTNQDLMDNLGSAMLLSDHLTFLCKYHEFHKLYEESLFQEAGVLLVSLLTSKLAPKSLWLTLLLDVLPLLEHQQVVFSSSQTYELLHCLQEISLSFRSDEYMHAKEEMQEKGKQDQKGQKKEKHSKTNKDSTDEEPDKISLLRLALARNLARSILKEGRSISSDI